MKPKWKPISDLAEPRANPLRFSRVGFSMEIFIYFSVGLAHSNSQARFPLTVQS